MLAILSTTIPIFLIIALGYLSVRLDYFPKAHVRLLGMFVIKVAMPALLLKAFTQRSFSETFEVRYLAAYGLGSAATFAVGLLLSRQVGKRDLASAAMNALGMSASNTGFIGYPIALQLLGPVASIGLALNMLVENLLVIPLALVLAEKGSADGEPALRLLLRTLVKVLTNPLILFILIGFFMSLLDRTLPGPLLRTVDILAMAAAPVSLFTIGGTLVGLKMRGMAADVLQVVVGKLLLHPLAVFCALLLFPLLDAQLRMAAVTFACAPMLSIYPLLGQKYGKEEVCAAALMAATTVSFLSITMVLWAVTASGAIPGRG